MTGKRWLVTKHANEKILERRIPVGTVRNAVEKGVQIEDKASGAMRLWDKSHRGMTLKA